MSLAVVPLLLGLLALVAPAPAAATVEPAVEYSTDGQTWSTQPPGLFDGDLVVPGERLVDTLWVRHQHTGAAQVSITAAPEEHAEPESAEPADSGAADADLRTWLDLTIEGTPLEPGQTWPGPVLEPGEPAALTLQVQMHPQAPLHTRNASAQMLSHLTVRAQPPAQPGPDQPGVDQPGVDESGLDPDTGADEREAQRDGDRDGDRGSAGWLPGTGWSGTALVITALVLLVLGGVLRRRRAAA